MRLNLNMLYATVATVNALYPLHYREVRHVRPGQAGLLPRAVGAAAAGPQHRGQGGLRQPRHQGGEATGDVRKELRQGRNTDCDLPCQAQLK